MRSLVNKVFTPRAITALKGTVTELIEYHLAKVDNAQFDVVAEFSALFPVEVISTVLGVPAEHRQQIREWVDGSLHRRPGQIEMDETNWRRSPRSERSITTLFRNDEGTRATT